MLTNFKELLEKYNIEPKGLIQIGAHEFQERNDFLEAGIKYFVLIEPQKKVFEKLLEASKGINVLHYKHAISNYTGKLPMYCDSNNYKLSSSLLQPKYHLKQYPAIDFNDCEFVNVDYLDNIYFERNRYNILFMDTQGNELNVLKSGIETLDYIDAIYTEINFIEMYRDCALIDDIDNFLSAYNFKRVFTGPDQGGWTDAFYVKYK